MDEPGSQVGRLTSSGSPAGSNLRQNSLCPQAPLDMAKGSPVNNASPTPRGGGASVARGLTPRHILPNSRGGPSGLAPGPHSGGSASALPRGGQAAAAAGGSVIEPAGGVRVLLDSNAPSISPPSDSSMVKRLRLDAAQIEKATAAGDAPATWGWLVRTLLRTAVDIKASATTIRRSPAKTLLLPAVALALCLGMGLMAVMVTSSAALRQSRTNGGFAAENAIMSLKQRLDGLLSPLASVVTYTKRRPGCVELQAEYIELAATGMAWAATTSSVLQLQLVPYGVLTMIYPAGASPDAIGLDVFTHPYRRDDGLRVAAGGRMTLEGPYNLVEGGFAAIAYEPIYVNATYRQPNGAIQGCERGPINCTWECNSFPGKAFWGYACALLDLEPVQRGQDPMVTQLKKENYLYRLWRPASSINSNIEIGASDPLPKDPVHRTLDFFGAQWALEVSPVGGWTPDWRSPCIAAVVVASFLLSGLLLLLLVAKEQHEQLLRQMLPAKAIKWLATGKGAFVDAFETTTVLFSDCVSYTSMSSELSPLDIVIILNEMYEEFDALSRKHGVYKVQTIGDAFMCTSGCPVPEDGPTGAARMAEVAMAMISFVESFVSSNGYKMQIRVGLHSGPVVAGVLGTRMPRYCIFGDTVNTAARMETNSRAMLVHISAVTAALLREAEALRDPGLGPVPWRLTPRGTITVKGKGEMETFWLEPAANEGKAAVDAPGGSASPQVVTRSNSLTVTTRQPSRLSRPPDSMP